MTADALTALLTHPWNETHALRDQNGVLKTQIAAARRALADAHRVNRVNLDYWRRELARCNDEYGLEAPDYEVLQVLIEATNDAQDLIAKVSRALNAAPF